MARRISRTTRSWPMMRRAISARSRSKAAPCSSTSRVPRGAREGAISAGPPGSFRWAFISLRRLPQGLHLLQARPGDVGPLLDVPEPVDEPIERRAQRALRVHTGLAGEVGHREEEVADLVVEPQ